MTPARPLALLPLVVLALATVPATGITATPADSARAATPAAAAPAPAPAPVPSAGTPVTLADGSTVRHMVLANGLRIVTRHLPGAKTAAITLGYRLGFREDPPQREGLAELVGQVAFTGRAGDVPERTFAEMDQLRPTGWSLRVNSWLTLLTEACPSELVPAVLHQVAERLHGVTPGDSLVSRSREVVRRRLRQNYDRDVAKSLYFLTGEMAAGAPPDRAERYGTGAGLDRITTREVAATLRERIVPANCVLSVTGDLTGIDVRTLVERSTGAVASGAPAPAPPWGRTRASDATLVRPDLTGPVGAVAVLAPALTDSMHAYFSAFSVAAAAILGRTWGRAAAPLTSRFQYNIANDPELVRFYPPATDSVSLERLFQSHFTNAFEAISDSASIRIAANGIGWLAGGALPADLFKRALEDPQVVHTLSTTLASLELYGDDTFWSAYRERLQRARALNLTPFFKVYDEPRRRVVLTLKPQRTSAR